MVETVFKSQGLHFKYSESSPFVLQTEGFEIFENETIAIIGPSGEGKSTLLRIMEGSLQASPREASQKPLSLSKKSAMIYQDLRLVAEKTALENTLMGALSRLSWKQFGFSEELVEEAKGLLSALGLESFYDQPVSMLSGGQKQRVAIARALMSQPSLLLADEPLSHLDHQTAVETFQLLKKLQAKLHFAMVITIHSNKLSDFSFDKIWRVSQGKLYFSSEIYERRTSGAGQASHQSSIVQISVFLLFLATLVASLVTLPTSGFNAEGALSELLLFLQKVFVHRPSELGQVQWGLLLQRMLVTIQMALIGTVIGFVLAWPLGFLSAEGISFTWITQPLRFFLMCLRSIPALIWALFFVAAVGLGPVAGIAALSLYSVGYFTKFLYEGIEDLERKPFHALRWLGASRIQAIRYAIMPSSKPLLISSFVFMLEYNVRSASLLGLVGAGGIGQDLMYSIEWRDYPTVFAILILMIAVVLIFDRTSAFIRFQIRKLRGI